MADSSIRRLYLYCTEEALLSIINEGKLKVSQPWGTNDITEGVPQGSSCRPPFVEQHGYICFSKTCTSPAMWGYYAQRSQGAVIAFDIAGVLSTSGEGHIELFNPNKWGRENVNGYLPGRLVEVRYSAQRDAEGKDYFSMLSLKSPTWQAEQEYRYIIPLHECEFQGIETKNGVALGIYKTASILQFASGIILGPECRLKEALIQGKLQEKEDCEHIPADIAVTRIKWSEQDFEFIEPQEVSYIDISRKYRETLYKKHHPSMISFN